DGNGGRLPTVKTQGGRAALGHGQEDCLIDGHIHRAGQVARMQQSPFHESHRSYLELDAFARDGRQRKTGCRAARVSSSRPTGVSWGAVFTFSGSSSTSRAIAINASASRSIASKLSVSVGSIMIASSTMRGK